jgi:N utilization substance protein A
VVSGVVQRFERGNVYIDLGRAIGVMFGGEAVPGEHYRSGERLRFLVLAVQEDTRLPGIILSRAHPKFVSKLFEMEVPEVAEGTVEVKVIAREPGSRTKIAVASNSEGVDPVGALVGQRGTRVMAVNNELGQEKIDICEWSEDPARLIGNSISPAKAESVEIMPHREARVYVSADQLSLAIGRGGQNVRLAAKLTGWKIDVRSETQPNEIQEGGVSAAPDEDEPANTAVDETPEED